MAEQAKPLGKTVHRHPGGGEVWNGQAGIDMNGSGSIREERGQTAAWQTKVIDWRKRWTSRGPRLLLGRAALFESTPGQALLFVL